MKIMTCPVNGPRNISEFAWAGEVTRSPDPAQCSDREWTDFLFIENNGLAARPVIGFFHGRFPLRITGPGPDEMLKFNGEPLSDVGEIGQEKRVSRPATRRALSHDEFSLRIRGR